MDKKPEDFSLIRKDAPMEDVDTEKLGEFMKDKII
jgi:hypothetical protein